MFLLAPAGWVTATYRSYMAHPFDTNINLSTQIGRACLALDVFIVAAKQRLVAKLAKG